jgi:hypothetical protein
MTKPVPKAKYLLAATYPLHRNAITSDAVTRLWRDYAERRCPPASVMLVLAAVLVLITALHVRAIGNGTSPQQSSRYGGSAMSPTNARPNSSPDAKKRTNAGQ